MIDDQIEGSGEDDMKTPAPAAKKRKRAAAAAPEPEVPEEEEEEQEAPKSKRGRKTAAKKGSNRKGKKTPTKKSPAKKSHKRAGSKGALQGIVKITEMDLESGFVTLTNEGGAAVLLDGWSLQAENSRLQFKFPDADAVKAGPCLCRWLSVRQD